MIKTALVFVQGIKRTGAYKTHRFVHSRKGSLIVGPSCNGPVPVSEWKLCSLLCTPTGKVYVHKRPSQISSFRLLSGALERLMELAKMEDLNFIP